MTSDERKKLLNSMCPVAAAVGLGDTVESIQGLLNGGVPAHAQSHGQGEADPVQIAQSQVTDLVQDLAESSVRPQTLDVSLDPAKGFTSVAAALASITDAASTKPYQIRVFPGTYSELPLVMKPWVSVIGQGGWRSVTLEARVLTQHFISGCGNANLRGVTVRGPTTPGTAAIDFQDGSTGAATFFVDDVIISRCSYGIWSHPSAYGSVHVHNSAIKFFSGSTQTGIRVTDSGNVTAMSTSVVVATAGAITDGVYVSGNAATVNLDVCSFRGGNAGAAPFVMTNCVHIDDGSRARLTACTMTDGVCGIRVGATGSGTELYAFANSIGDSFSDDLLVETANSIISYDGSAHSSKVTVPDGTVAAIAYTDDSIGSSGRVVHGDLYLESDVDRVPVGSYLRDTPQTGFVSGGSLSRGLGLDLDVAAGVGYITAATGLLTQVDWQPATLHLPASAAAIWIQVDAAGTVSYSVSQPDLHQVIVLGDAATGPTTIPFLASRTVGLWNRAANQHAYFYDVMGPLHVSGGVVTKHAPVSTQLDVDTCTFYVANNRRVSATTAAIARTRWYRDGSGGWKFDTSVNYGAYWDDGTGTLALMPPGTWKKSALYVCVNDSGTEFHSVFGQELFNNSGAAEAGPMPVSPDVLRNKALVLAGIVVDNAGTDIFSVVDVRPRLGQLASGSTSITDHGLLQGLGDDDHPQYQLRTEKGLALGYAGLDAGALVPSTQLPLAVSGPGVAAAGAAAVGQSLNLAREDHNHSVAVAAPVAVGTANAIGGLTTLALSDHVHSHGLQTLGTLHAAVVAGSTSGFMTGADKTKLDGVPADAASGSHTVTAGSGLSGGGSLSSTDIAVSVKAHADASVAVSAAGVQVGILASDSQHGLRGGGTQHAQVTGAVDGFMIAADKTKLDGVAAGATALALTGTAPVAVDAAAAAVGNATAAARGNHKHSVSVGVPVSVGVSNSQGSATTLALSDHGHDHGLQTAGTLHAAAISNSTSGFMTGADKAKLDAVAAQATNTPLADSAPVDVDRLAGTAGAAATASRSDHKHGVTTAAPVAIGTVNNAGTASGLARADHVHDHGSQTLGTLHAAVIAGSTSGFMTGADKTKLDGVAAGATASPLAVSVLPVNIAVAAAAYGNSTEAARANHQHNISVAVPVAVGAANAEGGSTSLARADHVHAHSQELVQTQMVEVILDTTTASATFVDLLSLTLTTGANSIIVQATFAAGNTNANIDEFFRVVIDGVAVRGAGIRVITSSGASSGAISCKRAVTAAAHTVKLQWRTSNNTARIRPVTAPDAEHACLIVSEVTV